MKRLLALIVGFAIPLSAVSFAAAETKVTVENTHLCCPKCVKAATKAVESVNGDKAVCDMKTNKITITADNDADAQKAVDALVEAGFFGKVSSGTIKNDSGAPAAAAKSVTVTTHNCCKKCTAAITKIVEAEGCKTDAKGGEETFAVTGDIDPQKLAKAFNDAGFAVKVAAK